MQKNLEVTRKPSPYDVNKTRLPSNMGGGIRDMSAFSYTCSLPVTHVTKMIIRFVVPKNRMQHANSMALCLIERELSPI